MKKKLTLEETINECLDTVIKDLHPVFRGELYELLLSNPSIAESKDKSKTYIRTLFTFPKQGSYTKQYWIARGWSEIESIYKSKEKNKTKNKGFSPFSIEFWLNKINPKTNKLYLREDAEYKRNSQRPIKKEYWIELGFSEERSILLAENQKYENNNSGAQSSKNRSLQRKRASSIRCVEYYLLRGFTEEGAIYQVSLNQSTFSLEICIEKYGEELGREVWLKRQQKWQDKLNSKSQEEIESINKKKSNLMSYSNLWTNKSIFDGKFYLLEIQNGFYKIGITSRTIKERYPKNKDYKILLEFNSSINHCFQIEQLLKRYYKEQIISKTEAINGFGWTETLKNVNITELLNQISILTPNSEYTTKLFKESFNLNYAENF